MRGALANGIGRTKGGRNTKLHAVWDDKGRPFVLLLTSGNTHDCKVAQQCIEALPSSELVADKGYDSQALREWLSERGTQPVIPPRKNRKIQYDYDKAIYKQRNVIERMSYRLKDWRRIATRFDRKIERFNGRIASEVMGINVAGHADLEILLTGFNRAYNRRRQRVLHGSSPCQKAEERIGLMPALANPLYKPTAPDDLLTKVDDILYYANDVSQPDS
jgi:transposase